MAIDPLTLKFVQYVREKFGDNNPELARELDWTNFAIALTSDTPLNPGEVLTLVETAKALIKDGSDSMRSGNKETLG